MSLAALSDLFAADRRANHIVALKDGEAIRFERFAADVGGVAARAAAHPAHRRTALVCGGSYAFTVGLFGLLLADCEIVLPPNGQSGTLESLRDHFDLLVDDDFVRGSTPASPAPIRLDAARPNIIVFTSGSTGVAKRIVKTLAMFEREIVALDSLWGEDVGQGPALSTVPHQHIYGMTFKILWPLASGRAFADQTDELWESLLAKLTPGATVVSSPTHLSRIGGLAPLPAGQRPSRIFSAGAPLSYDAAVASGEIFGCRPTEIFGSTETGAIATREQADGEDPWRALPGIAIRQDDSGRLCLRSPWVSDDWFETADMIDPAPGGFRFLGRADRIVKIEGKRISLPEVEDALRHLPWIKAAAVTLLSATPGRLAAAVVLNEDGREKLTVLGRFRFGRMLRQALATTQEAAGRPRLWRFIDDLPAPDGMGKRRENDIRALFESAP